MKSPALQHRTASDRCRLDAETGLRSEGQDEILEVPQPDPDGPSIPPLGTRHASEWTTMLKNLAVAAALVAALIAQPVDMAQAQKPSEVIPHAQDRPPGPALSPQEAIARMTVPEGFSVELVASEPNIVNPVAMTFDAKGRIWITESLEYPRREPGPGRDRVKVLEDTDGDGKADTFTIFIEGLNIPSGVAVGHGGVWVANAPDILFIPDADGDLKPDGPPQVIVTGFGRDDTHELPNSLTWGPDGWLYGWNGVFNRSHVTYRGKTYDFTCAIFRIHPKTRDFELFCEGTSNPWGIAINENGDFFASACVIDHLWHLVESAYYIRQGGPYPPFTWPMGSIVDHKHQKAAYCGIHYFDSAAYPEAYRGKLFMGNIHGNCVNVDRLERDGSTYKAEATPDFLSANDAWFMPVVQKTGPDGCLYILDWYDRYHCYQDANRDPAGIDRLKGRLYRVRYKNTPRRAGFDLARESDATLIQHLGSPNVYDRDIAQRLLTERLLNGKASPTTRAALKSLVLDDSSARKARIHGLWALVASGSLDPTFHLALLNHSDATFRAWGVRAAGNMGKVEENVRAKLTSMTGDASPDVRLQVAIAARKLKAVEPLTLLLEILSKSQDPLMPHVVWQNLHPMLDEPATVARLVELTKSHDTLRSPQLAALMPRILERAIAAGSTDAGTIARLIILALEQLGDDAIHRACLDTLTEQVRQGRLQGERLNGVRERLTPMVHKALGEGGSPLRKDYAELAAAWGDANALNVVRSMFASDKADENNRLQALDVLISTRDAGVVGEVARMLSNRDGSAEFRGRVLAAIGPLDDARIAQVVLTSYPDMEPVLKPKAIELLTQRPAWSRALIAAVEAKAIPTSALNVNQLRRLQASRDRDIADKIKAIWGSIRQGRNEQRELVVGQMRNFLHKTSGDPNAGQAVFQKLCAQCHKIYGEGQDVGPDITLNGRNDFDQLISNVFDPSLVIGQGYQATTVATTDGRVLTGLLAEDSKERVILKIQGGKVETIPRAEVEEMKTNPLSLMPEDIETQLSPQEIADLFAYLALDKPPGDPNAKRLPGSPEAKAGSR